MLARKPKWAKALVDGSDEYAKNPEARALNGEEEKPVEEKHEEEKPVEEKREEEKPVEEKPVEEKREEEKPVEKKHEEEKPVEEKPDPVPYAKITEHFKKLCPSYPSIRGITGERKVKVAARWKENPDMETFDTLFRTAEASDFMKGQNNQRWKADFDWMMVAGNFMKVLEGKYNNRQPEVRGSFDTDEFFEASLLRSYGPENGGERK